ncbi:MAG TPA: dipeptidase [Ignavibacteria bacterium]|nr:dipeptidase [Ignavibacteria bacterium]
MGKEIQYIEKNKDRYLNELKEFLKIPSISTNPENKNDVRKCAEFVKDKMINAGLENVKIYETKGHPVVYGQWLKAGADKPTLLIYGHYDVQPVDPVDLWTNPPFEPVIKGNKIYARGATDDKGQAYMYLKSIEAFMKNDGKVPVNVKVIIEGEEEIGSENLEPFLQEYKEMLKCDYVVVSDTAMYDEGMPAITYGLRGLSYNEVLVTGPNRDLHSGSFGGTVENPANALANMIAKLKDDKGRILIPGFYDDVRKLSDKEREEFKKLPYDEKKYKGDLEVDELFGEEGYITEERRTARPTLDVNGIWGGFQGEGAKTVLPSKAGAKISMRLVPDQNPNKIDKAFADYIKKIAPKSVKVEVKSLHNAKPAITSIESEAVKCAVTALKKAYGREPLFTREGGSIPIVNTFKEILGSDTILLGFGLHTENAHSPDEHFDLNNFYKGIESITYFLEELGKTK